jgi:hypothetical protein
LQSPNIRLIPRDSSTGRVCSAARTMALDQFLIPRLGRQRSESRVDIEVHKFDRVLLKCALECRQSGPPSRRVHRGSGQSRRRRRTVDRGAPTVLAGAVVNLAFCRPWRTRNRGTRGTSDCVERRGLQPFQIPRWPSSCRLCESTSCRAETELVANAGANALLQVDANEDVSLIAVFHSRGSFPSRPSFAPAGFEEVTDAVPTSITTGPDGAYYISELTGGSLAGVERC